MKFRESGMPDEEIWNSYFYPEKVLDKLGVSEEIHHFLDIGCGYGTFLFPAAKRISGKAIGIDIDKYFLNCCYEKRRSNKQKNIELIEGDILEEETKQAILNEVGLVDYVSLFNILHCEEPVKVLENVMKLIKPKGKIAIVHWNYDDTPRGPSLAIRPKQEDITQLMEQVGGSLIKQVNLPPHHFGLLFVNKET
ncbi:class I SAM-dependent methyltransferase [Evansella sp. AB-P1]|uniref:class I SAM-dependent methyltransferase n=1 Tax=Evansella sp. AB-P1 TaxID=3037653 RepID=UPI00241D1ADC|nr:class I SAM-dependent methyltransferase [Evansella sp. AB-P1]MDG5787259.1 class I SAM-dependent methyltransferase [Evansella sp. AB-P1]